MLHSATLIPVGKQRFELTDIIDRLRVGRLIVSCQAQPNEPLFGSAIMAKMAIAAQQGGACAIRANTPQDIAAIREAVDLPIIGLYKVDLPGYDVYITPRVEDAVAVADSGADIIAIDATNRLHPFGDLADYIASIKCETGLPVMADISTFDEAQAAKRFGADFVSTTMSGYTPYSPALSGPDLELVTRLARILAPDFPLIAEGRYHTPEMAAAALEAGALAVVVGGAITRPQQITARFKNALRSSNHDVAK